MIYEAIFNEKHYRLEVVMYIFVRQFIAVSIFLFSVSCAADINNNTALNRSYTHQGNKIYEFVVNWGEDCTNFYPIIVNDAELKIDPDYDRVYDNGVSSECIISYSLWLSQIDSVLSQSVSRKILNKSIGKITIPIPVGVVCDDSARPYQRMFKTTLEKVFNKSFIKNHKELYTDSNITMWINTGYLYDESDVFKELKDILRKYGFHLVSFGADDNIGFHDKSKSRDEWPAKYREDYSYKKNFVTVECSPVGEFRRK